MIFDSCYSILRAINAEKLGGENVRLDSEYSEYLYWLELIGGDVTRKYNSIYSIIKEIIIASGGEVSYWCSVYSELKYLAELYGCTPKPYDSVYSILLDIYYNGEFPSGGFQGLCFTAVDGDATFAMNNFGTNAPDVKYSTDGETWTQWDYSEITIPNGERVFFKGNNGSQLSSSMENYSQFVMTGKIAASGNIMSLLDDGACTSDTVGDYCFFSLFMNMGYLIEMPELPATTLAPYCYKNIFVSTSLYSVKNLPATTLAEGCYMNMFNNIQTSPDLSNFTLPATTLAYKCYMNMFMNASNITTAPLLQATTLAEGCYQAMFYGCSSLTTAPELPATTLAVSCYQQMFQNTKLTTAPELPATTLEPNCYRSMFSDCTSLVNAQTILPATTLATNCYYNMYAVCTSLQTTPELPATIMKETCYYGMFYGCSSLTTAKPINAQELAIGCFNRMYTNCSSLVSVPRLSIAANIPNKAFYNTFINCASLTSVDYEFTGNSVGEESFAGMFANCTNLVTINPNMLQATTLGKACYKSLFSGCKNLTVAPILKATTLVSECYQSLFLNCKKINYIKAMFTTTPSTSYTNNWVSGVATTGTFVKNAAATWTGTGVTKIPSGWTVETATS